MTRPPYEDLPAEVRAAVDRVLGSPVVAAVSQSGGFSPGMAARVRCADGRTGFVKAVSALVDPVSPQMHRDEARVTARLPAGLGSPRLLGSYDDGTWVALVLEEVDGVCPALPQDLPAVLRALDRLSEVPAPPGVPPLADVLGEEFRGWERMAAARVELPDWQRRHLDELVELERGWRDAAAGDRLLHLAVRTDNLLLRADGEAVLVDWPSAAAGNPMLDVVAFLPSAVLEGAAVPEDLLRRTRAGRAADPLDVTRLLAAFCGRMAEHARKPPAPALPTVRVLQAAQAGAAGAWLRERTGWA